MHYNAFVRRCQLTEAFFLIFRAVFGIESAEMQKDGKQLLCCLSSFKYCFKKKKYNPVISECSSIHESPRWRKESIFYPYFSVRYFPWE